MLKLKWPRVKALLYGMSVVSFTAGVVDYYFVSQVCAHLTLWSQYGVNLFRHVESQPFQHPALITILVSLVVYLILSVVAVKEKRKWLPLLLFALTFALNGALPPVKHDAPETTANFVRILLANGIECLFNYGLCAMIKVAYLTEYNTV